MKDSENIRIALNATVIPTDDFTDFMWIVRRQHVVYEGANKCASRSNCFEAYRRRNIRDAPANLFKLTLEIDELTRDVLDDPVVLVKTYRKHRESKEMFIPYFVSRWVILRARLHWNLWCHYMSFEISFMPPIGWQEKNGSKRVPMGGMKLISNPALINMQGEWGDSFKLK